MQTPEYVLALVGKVLDWEDIHSGDMPRGCFSDVLGEVPKEVQAEARGYRRGRERGAQLAAEGRNTE